MKFVGMTDPGKVRSNNQDNFYCDERGRFAIVADGMGGHAAGAMASQEAVEASKNKILGGWSQTPAAKLLDDAVAAANQAILDDQRRHADRADMGTTVVVLLLDREGECWSAHIGDSRLYVFRQQKLIQLTQDHTLVARSVRMGEMTLEQSRTHPWRHILERCLGRPDTGSPAIQHIALQPGDRILMCSDGLTEELEDQEIERYCAQGSLMELPQQLIEAAKNNGGRDNITVVIGDYQVD
ncbi:MAG: Stp1/IreP family PP2C-type Ser/Thr phosphatase [Thermostichales cyanobacterium SRBZ-1_bins_19]